MRVLIRYPTQRLTIPFTLMLPISTVKPTAKPPLCLLGINHFVVKVPVTNINRDLIPATGKEFQINTTNLGGEYEKAKGTIKIYSLKAPSKTFRTRLWQQADRTLYSREQYYQLFPYDQYEDETNKYLWSRDREVFTLNYDTEQKKTFTPENLHTWSPGEYVLEITGADKDGQEVKDLSYFTVFSPSSKVIPTPSVHYFEGVDLSAEPGEKATFAAGTSDKKIRVLYEVERDGELLSKEWITLNNQQRLFEIPIKEEHRGNLAVHYTFIKNNRVYAENATVVVPYTNKELEITFESFRDKLQPGQQEQWKILIKGKTADAVAAEMVATLYDESLDEFRFHNWYANFYNSFHSRMFWKASTGFNSKSLTGYIKSWNPGHSRSPHDAYFDSFNWFGYSFYYSNDRLFRAGGRSELREMPMAAMAVPDEMKLEENMEESTTVEQDTSNSPPDGRVEENVDIDLSQVKVRKRF